MDIKVLHGYGSIKKFHLNLEKSVKALNNHTNFQLLTLSVVFKYRYEYPTFFAEEKERFDTELDKNKDGSLDRPEILAWMIPSNDDIARDEVEHLFAGADEDVDEILTFDEVLSHHDLFVGSEATDYGEHLNNLHKFEDEL